MKQYNSQILKINHYPLKVCKYPLIGIILDGSCTLKKFNRTFSFNTQDVFFINPDEVYAIQGEC
ncbi:MAG: hypothetical protein ACI4WM_08485, partial [Erysipelotrichaceae bacterium]